MSVSDGQAGNAATFNGAYWSKDTNSTGTAQYSLNNADSSSGSSVTNIQRELNAISSWTGKSLNVAKDTVPTWSSNDIGASTDSLFDRLDGVGSLFDASTGHGHTGVAGDAPPIDLTTSVTGELPVANISDTVSRWEQYTVTASSFTASGTTEDIELFSLPASGVVESIIIKHSEAFSGSALVSYSIDIGPSADINSYVSGFDVFQAAAASAFEFNIVNSLESFASAISIRAKATASGDGVDGASAGSFDIWVKRSDLG